MLANKPVIRMSNCGKCPRALSAQLLGKEAEPAPVWLEVAAEEGKWHEQRIVEKLKDKFHVFDQQLEVQLDFPSFCLLGHIDGKIEDYDHQRPPELLEIKSMSQFEFDRWMKGRFDAFPGYAFQLTVYMEATEASKALYIVKNRSSGYEDRQVIEGPPRFMTELIARLTDVTTHILGNELCVAEFDPQSTECRRCEYRYLCMPEAKELTPLQKADLDSAAEEWRKGKALVEKGQALIDIAREAFEQHTKATNILMWQHLGLAIQLIRYKEQKTYPKANLLKLFSEEVLEPACKMKEAYDQLRVNDLKGEDSNAN